MPGAVGDEAIHKASGKSIYVWNAASKLVLLLAITCMCLPLTSFAQEDVNKILESDDDTFRSRDVLDHSAFDVLNEQDRYKNETKNVFDVTEGNMPVEEAESTTSPAGVEIKLSAPVIEDTVGSYHNTAKLVAINKITARSKQLSIKVGQSAYFGNIEIFVEKCWNNGDVYSPSSKILVKILESKIDEDSKNIFHGWLISSNIPVSGLQDPSYELIAVDCHDN